MKTRWEGADVLEKIRDGIGPFNFASQYQQRPESPEGSLIKRKYIKVINQTPSYRPGGIHWVSIDSALLTSFAALVQSHKRHAIRAAR